MGLLDPDSSWAALAEWDLEPYCNEYFGHCESEWYPQFIIFDKKYLQNEMRSKLNAEFILSKITWERQRRLPLLVSSLRLHRDSIFVWVWFYFALFQEARCVIILQILKHSKGGSAFCCCEGKKCLKNWKIIVLLKLICVITFLIV